MKSEFYAKIGFWIEFIGVIVWMIVLLLAFWGKGDAFLERMMWIVLLAGAGGFVICQTFFRSIRGAGIFYIFAAVLLVGVSIFAISKGYASGKASDCGVHSFVAVKYWQEEHSTKIRHRITKSYTNYVKYEALLENREKVSYKRTTSSIGDAMNLVKKKDVKERQVFLYNGNYYPKEPGMSVKEFLSDFLRWRRILFLGAGIYGMLGVLFFFCGKISDEKTE